ncbi:hypothetical protein NX059_001842 [Plenodomus lindquistii]|nr:hypothetical protein NX059_001842 [Plenodomus lindquistii]
MCSDERREVAPATGDVPSEYVSEWTAREEWRLSSGSAIELGQRPRRATDRRRWR